MREIYIISFSKQIHNIYREKDLTSYKERENIRNKVNLHSSLFPLIKPPILQFQDVYLGNINFTLSQSL